MGDAMSLLGHEEVVVHRGERTGISLVIAIHSTVLGPALGGARLWRYGALGDGIADALRLSEAMTYKAAAAGLDLGGGKGLNCLPPGNQPRPAGPGAPLLELRGLVVAPQGRHRTA